MSKAEKENLDLDKFKKEIADQLLPFIVNDLYKNGEINENELDDKKTVYEKTLKHFVNNNDFEIETLIDHRNSILKTAKEYEKSNFDLSNTLYATFIEHTLNYIIQSACHNSEIDRKTTTEIIRNVNISGKSTWLIKLLGLRPINKKHIKTILKTSELRNAYIHYKWKPDKSKGKDENEHLKNVKEMIKYLRTYETKVEFEGKKKIINRTINSK
jgi:hypothetical protein